MHRTFPKCPVLSVMNANVLKTGLGGKEVILHPSLHCLDFSRKWHYCFSQLYGAVVWFLWIFWLFKFYMNVHLNGQIILGNIHKLEYRNTLVWKNITFWENTHDHAKFCRLRIPLKSELWLPSIYHQPCLYRFSLLLPSPSHHTCLPPTETTHGPLFLAFLSTSHHTPIP